MDVSIIVPLYKGKKYISHIVEMIKDNQRVCKEKKTHIDIEIIFVNDYPDEEISDKDLDIDEKITLLLDRNERNLGIHWSRVKGLSIAKGQFVIFLDQDDKISPYYLYRQLKYIEQADAVLCNGVYREDRLIYKDIEHQKRIVSKYEFLKQGNYIVSPGQVMIKREAIPDKWTEHILKENGSDDALLWILMLCEEKRFSLNPYSDYIHIEDGENASLNFKKMLYSAEELLKVIRDYKLLSKEDFVIYKHILEERIDKHKKYSEVLNNWNNILNQLIEVCKLKKSIGIYGYGVIGKKLIHDLEDVNIKPTFIIDKAAKNFICEGYNICEPDDFTEEVDLIILTPLFATRQIKEELCKYREKVVSLDEFYK